MADSGNKYHLTRTVSLPNGSYKHRHTYSRCAGQLGSKRSDNKSVSEVNLSVQNIFFKIYTFIKVINKYIQY